MLTPGVTNSNYNQKTFQGKVIIDGDLSAIPTKMVRQSADKLKKMFEHQDFDLFIKQDYKTNRVIFTVAEEKDYYKSNKHFGIEGIDAGETTEDIYEAAANFALFDYKNSMWNVLFIKPPKTTFLEKLKNIIPNKQ